MFHLIPSKVWWLAIKLKTLLRSKKIIRSLGAHDVFSAVLAEQAGFETVFVGGFGASASLLGQPDVNLLTLTEMSSLVKRMAQRLSVPLVADGDTGHGGPENVARTIQDFEQAGAAGILIEDQVSPKRCGHFQGKSVVSMAEMKERLGVALKARKNSDFVVVGRTDARDVHGLDEAIKRANLFAKWGADVVFIESPHTEAELKQIPKKVKAPLLVNMLTGGKTPNLPVSTLEKMGYKIVVYPIESLLVFAHGMKKLAHAILEKGSINDLNNDMIQFSEIKKILGLDKLNLNDRS